jgi:hypothetical protein
MLTTTSGGFSHTVVVPNEEALHRLVTDFAMRGSATWSRCRATSAPADTFARALIRHPPAIRHRGAKPGFA